MTIQQVKRLCWTATALMGGGSIAVLAAAVWLRYDAGGPARDGTQAAVHASAARSTPRPTQADYEPYLDTTLRRPLPKAAPPPPPAPVQPQAAPVPAVDTSLTLVGTVIEASNSCALFQTTDGVELKRVGETIAGSTVTDITEGVVSVRRVGGEQATVRVPVSP
jgi:hypothetical protein